MEIIRFHRARRGAGAGFAGRAARAAGAAASAQDIAPAEIEAAEVAYAAEDWDAAATAYAALAERAPWSGPWWLRLGEASARRGDAAGARRAFVRMRETGHRSGRAAFELGALAAGEGDYAAAAGWVETAFREGYNNAAFLLQVDPRFAPAFGDADFAEKFRPRLPADAPRAEQWRVDLDHLDRMYRLAHIDPFGGVSQGRWRAEVEALKARADGARDAEMAAGLMRLMALAGDGHTLVFTPYGDDLFGVAQTPAFFTIAPVEFYDFGGEIRVIATSAEHRELLGARVERIGALAAEDAYRRVRAYTPADNPYQQRWMAQRFLATPELLHAAGVSADPARFEVVARRDDGRRVSATLEGAPFAEDRKTRAVPALPERVLAADPAERPLYLQNAEEPFLLHHDEQSSVLYVQINTLLDDGAQTVEALGTQIAEALKTRDPRALVLDLRWNSGGDSGLNRHVVNAVAGSSVDAPGRLFTVIGRRTFSAAINLTSALKAYTHTLLVGEPSGSSPNFVGETNGVFLPNTGMIVSVSNRRHQGLLSDRRDRWWTPDLPAEPSWADYEAGVDPAMTAITAYLETVAE